MMSDSEAQDVKVSLMGGKTLKQRRCWTCLAVVIVLVVVLVGLIVGLTYLKSPKSDVHNRCTMFEPSASSTPPGGGSTGQKWRDQDCHIPDKVTCPKGYTRPPTLLLSMDGFWAGYLDRGLTPNIERLSTCGVSSDYMRPAFPSKTFPNHYSIITGLYPEAHGIIDNWMYDNVFHEVFTLGGTIKDQGKWWSGEPIWNSVMKAGKKAASIYWPSSESDIQGMMLDYCYTFNGSLPFEWRVDGMLSWLDLPEHERPELIATYFNQPDKAGHEFGPSSSQVNGNISYVDAILGMLMDGLVDRQLDKCVNIVLVSDHGMTSIDCSHESDLSSLVDPATHFIYTGVMGRITSDYTLDEQGNVVILHGGEPAEDIVSQLQCAFYNNSELWYTRTYLKQDLPKRIHFANNRRIEDVIVMVQDGELVKTKAYDPCRAGDHGYDNTYQNMQALFSAYGPSLKQGYNAGAFENIEVYNLLLEISQISGGPNNGTKGRLHDLLRSASPLPEVDQAAKGAYEHCPFPDLVDRQQRRQASDCSCDSIHTVINETLDEIDQHLYIDPPLAANISEHILPLGVPTLAFTSGKTCQLIQRTFTTGYSVDYYMPLWVAYTLDKQDSLSSGLLADCLRVDVRLGISEAAQCSSYIDANISWQYMYPPNTPPIVENQLDAYISTNVAPMYKGFKDGVWNATMSLLEQYATKFQSLVILVGPVFDYNSDGQRDSEQHITKHVGSGPVPIPSHFFVTASRCNSSQHVSECQPEHVQTLSLVLPHKPTMDNCWEISPAGYFGYLQHNVARARDVELLTGLDLFTKLPTNIRVHLQTHLAIGLWDPTL